MVRSASASVPELATVLPVSLKLYLRRGVCADAEVLQASVTMAAEREKMG
jgi:hypothetical protein